MQTYKETIYIFQTDVGQTIHHPVLYSFFTKLQIKFSHLYSEKEVWIDKGMNRAQECLHSFHQSCHAPRKR